MAKTNFQYEKRQKELEKKKKKEEKLKRKLDKGATPSDEQDVAGETADNTPDAGNDPAEPKAD